MQKVAHSFIALACLSLIGWGGPIWPRATQRSLVSTSWLAGQTSSATILHIGDRAEYEAGHIPGAVLVELSSLITPRDGTPNELPPADVLERIFKAAGVGSRGRIILYSRDPIAAARAWFTLDYLGQGSRTALLDGGFARWVAQGHPVSTTAVVPKPGTFEARVNVDTVIRLARMSELVRIERELGPSLVIIDTRAPAQFTGEEAGPGIVQAGRIPGAVNVPVAANFDADGRFRTAEDLLAVYGQAGVSKTTANIVYCRTGMEASVSYFVLHLLGFDARLYDGSYAEWSNAGEISI